MLGVLCCLIDIPQLFIEDDLVAQEGAPDNHIQLTQTGRQQEHPAKTCQRCYSPNLQIVEC